MNTDQMLGTIRDAWDWTGVQAVAVVAVNEFGNVIVRDADGAFWRICPEELRFTIVARNAEDLAAIWQLSDFLDDWQMASVLASAPCDTWDPSTTSGVTA